MMKGFTLIEILVAMAIIGILVASALPQYQDYRKRAFDFRAQSDLRNLAIAEEAYFLQSEKYLGCSGQSCTALPGIKAISEGVSLQATTDDVSFTGTSSHSKGTGRVYTWNSDLGGLQ